MPTSRNDSEQRSSDEIMSHFWFETTTTKRQIIPHTWAVSFFLFDLPTGPRRDRIGDDIVGLQTQRVRRFDPEKNSGQKRMIPHRSNRVSEPAGFFSALPVWNPSLRGISRGEKPDWPRMRRGDPMIFGPGPRRDSSCGFQVSGRGKKRSGKAVSPPRRGEKTRRDAPHVLTPRTALNVLTTTDATPRRTGLNAPASARSNRSRARRRQLPRVLFVPEQQRESRGCPPVPRRLAARRREEPRRPTLGRRE